MLAPKGEASCRQIDRKAKREAVKIFGSMVQHLPVSVMFHLKLMFESYKLGENVTKFIRKYKLSMREG